MIVSIFNDVIGPVMRGPSSSHCAAALRIGRVTRDLMGGTIDRLLVQFDKSGSLPLTHESQGSDMGLFGGLLGWEADDERLPDSRAWIERAGVEVEFEYGDFGDPHPNTYRLTLSNQTRTRVLVAISTGGGMFEVIQIDGVDLSIGGDFDETLVWSNDLTVELDAQAICDELGADHVQVVSREQTRMVQIQAQQPIERDAIERVFGSDAPVSVDHLSAVLPIRSRRELSVPFRTCTEMVRYAEAKADAGETMPLWRLGIEYERARSGLGEAELIEKMCEIVRIVRRSVQQGLSGTEYADRVLGYQSGGFREAMDAGKLIDGGVLNRIVLYTAAMMEVKSSMGVIVAAPTAGACAAFPAVCLAIGENLELNDGDVAKSMFAGGLIGVFIATQWSFAAEVGGCQAEGGSAAAMSAAAMVSFQGGTLGQSVGAASMAMQNMLGLICDPVANRVEVPCLGKNVLAASNALSCANMALAGFDAVIPFDETIAAAKGVAEQMPRAHRCTALGGLSITPTSITIQKRLEKSRPTRA